MPQGIEDEHMNVMCLGGRTVGPAVAWDLVQTFLAAEFRQAERHLRRLGQVASLAAASLMPSNLHRLVWDLTSNTYWPKVLLFQSCQCVESCTTVVITTPWGEESKDEMVRAHVVPPRECCV